MDPFSVAASVLSIGNLLSGRKKQKRAAREEARVERELTDEEIRRKNREHRFFTASQRQATATNLIDLSSKSFLAVQRDTIGEQAREIQILRRVGASKANAALTRGSIAASQMTAQALGQAADLFGDLWQAFKPKPGGN